MEFPTRWIKIFKDIWGNKSRAMLVILSIAFVAMAFGWLIDDRAVALAEKVILLAVGAFIGLVTGKSI